MSRLLGSGQLYERYSRHGQIEVESEFALLICRDGGWRGQALERVLLMQRRHLRSVGPFGAVHRLPCSVNVGVVVVDAVVFEAVRRTGREAGDGQGDMASEWGAAGGVAVLRSGVAEENREATVGAAGGKGFNEASEADSCPGDRQAICAELVQQVVGPVTRLAQAVEADEAEASVEEGLGIAAFLEVVAGGPVADGCDLIEAVFDAGDGCGSAVGHVADLVAIFGGDAPLGEIDREIGESIAAQERPVVGCGQVINMHVEKVERNAVASGGIVLRSDVAEEWLLKCGEGGDRASDFQIGIDGLEAFGGVIIEAEVVLAGAAPEDRVVQ